MFGGCGESGKGKLVSFFGDLFCFCGFDSFGWFLGYGYIICISKGGRG